jgi:alpha-tubulin suppressor-like RCC1 family protein
MAVTPYLRDQRGARRPVGPTLGTFEPNATLAPILDAAGNELTGVTWLALGFNHSCALFEDGRVACWGSNGFGQLGNETNDNSQQDNPRALPVQGWPPAPPPKAESAPGG